MWWKKHKGKVILAVIVVLALAAAFFYGGGAPGLRGGQQDGAEPDGQELLPEEGAFLPAEDGAAETQTDPSAAEAVNGTENEAGNEAENSVGKQETTAKPESGNSPTEQSPQNAPDANKDPYQTEPVPAGKPAPVEPQEAEQTTETKSCSISISCSSILTHMDWLAEEKKGLVPADGVILSSTTVSFQEGENVFDVLQRVCKQKGIHMEFADTPMYNSAYIEGIANLYEFDCGELSGWMYSVNGWFPNYGCSRYALEDGDVIRWVYTCDLGADVGGSYAAGNK